MTMAVMIETGIVVVGQYVVTGDDDDDGVAHVRRHVETGDDDRSGLTLSLPESNCYRDLLAVVLSWSFDVSSVGWRLVGW